MSTTTAVNCAAVIAKIKRCAVRNGGVTGLLDLAQSLGLDDANAQSATVPRSSLAARLRETSGISLNEPEVATLFGWLDRHGEGYIYVAELVAALRFVGSPLRRGLVSRAWAAFAKDKTGLRTTCAEVLRSFSAEAHPRVLRGEVTAATVAASVAQTFSADRFPDGGVSRRAFELYCAAISATIDVDEHFACFMRGCWRLQHMSADRTAGLAFVAENEHALRTTMTVEEKAQVLRFQSLRRALDATIAEHRAAVFPNVGGCRAVGSALRAIDPSGTGFVSLDGFIAALTSLRLAFPASDLILFGFDTNGDGSVDYQGYLAALCGELPAARHHWVEMLWARLAALNHDSKGHVSVQTIVRQYKAPNGEALSLFLDVWDVRKAPNPSVSFDEFLEWFIPMSHSELKDVNFEARMKQEWADA